MVDYCNTRPPAVSSTMALPSVAHTTLPSCPFRTAKTRQHREKASPHHHHHHHHHRHQRGEISLGEGGDANQQARVRTVRLVRPQSHGHHHRNAPNVGGNFGFSIRGGLEYGTGFFISAIERDSEADRQGLKVGDQIIRVNGYQVEDAVHRELAQFIANQERLIMKVRGLGILPIKERSADPLTWHVVSFGSTRDKQDTLGSLLEDGCAGRDLKVILSVAPRTKLGCGICKGPDWKPGIFVQFTKEGGVAREAGLRPGDQILSCNGHSFAEASFGEAVGIMKSSHVLELVVRPSAGLDLFPGESSGYNSSASSVNGDQSPCWGDQTSKRLSIVREESISHERRRTTASTDPARGSSSEKSSPVVPPAPPPQPQQQPEPQQLPASGHAGGQAATLLTQGSRRKNTTIIEFSERGAIVNPEAKQSETKTVIVEVHRSASNGSLGGIATAAPSGIGGLANGTIIPPPPPLFADPGCSADQPVSSPQTKAMPEGRQGSAEGLSNSLSSAISDELRRRAQKKKQEGGTDGSGSAAATGPAAALTELENRLKEKGSRLRPVTMAISDERHTALMDEFRAVHKRMFKNGFDNAELKKQPPKALNSEVDGQQQQQNTPEASHADGQPGVRKSPKGTMGRVAASEMAKASGDSAELESIESFKLTNPQPPPARPPSYYFCPQATGPPTMKKSQKPIAVTISEYAHSASRTDDPKQHPNRFEFVQLRSVTEAVAAGGGPSQSSARLEAGVCARQVRP